MISVIASVQVKPGKKQEFLKSFKEFAVKVRKEKGCIFYFPAVDVKTDMPVQNTDDNRVTILERWESMEALNGHLASPDMQERMKEEADMVEGEADVKILQEA
jgi:quinol monooxygenase YgiN